SWSLLRSSAACCVTFCLCLLVEGDEETSRKRGDRIASLPQARRPRNAASSLVRKLALDKDGLEKRSLIDERGFRKLGERERRERVTQQVQRMSKRIGGFLVI
ncbi:hypothetical protein CCUS01_15168, partial [Colletotrichum cuscutae]